MYLSYCIICITLLFYVFEFMLPMQMSVSDGQFDLKKISCVFQWEQVLFCFQRDNTWI